jgi:hypothetical protein
MELCEYENDFSWGSEASVLAKVTREMHNARNLSDAPYCRGLFLIALESSWVVMKDTKHHGYPKEWYVAVVRAGALDL